MSHPTRYQNNVAPITSEWHSHCSTNMTSGAPTIHSMNVQAAVELGYISTAQNTQNPRRDTQLGSQSSPQEVLHSSSLEATRMGRQDSGYAAGQESSVSSPRTSISSSTRQLKSTSKRISTTRPSTKRASRSSPSSVHASRQSTSSRRPCFQTRHTTSSKSQAPYQFYQFPTLQDQEETVPAPPPPPPPATCQYWTSDSTRRLEYAAIDAASRGVKGFFIKLLPDCILPSNSRRTRFHCGDEASDAGSVRRYRLTLPEEKEASTRICEGSSRPRGLRRLTSAWRRGSS